MNGRGDPAGDEEDALSARVLGIDLGTTNSVVAVADADGATVLVGDDGEARIPSVVSFHPKGDIVVGQAGRDRRLLDATNTVYSVKRLIGRPYDSDEVRSAQRRFAFDLVPGGTGGVLVSARGETYTLSEISAFVLRKVRQVAEAKLGEPASRAVITVPANFNELQRSATKAAGRVAGLEVMRILNEPTAAALAYGFGKQERSRVAVYDLGGGTFDITLLELNGDVFEVLATAGDTYLGGDDIDRAIVDRMLDRFESDHGVSLEGDLHPRERLRDAAEWAKCQLSTQAEVQLCVEELGYGSAGEHLDLSFSMTRDEFESLAKPFVDRTIETCEDAFGVAGIRPTQLDDVILVGGSTRIPAVRRAVAEHFGKRPRVEIDPDLVVAQGAAIQGFVLGRSAPARGLARVPLKRVSLRVPRGSLSPGSAKSGMPSAPASPTPSTSASSNPLPPPVPVPPPPVSAPAAGAAKPASAPPALPPARSKSAPPIGGRTQMGMPAFDPASTGAAAAPPELPVPGFGGWANADSPQIPDLLGDLEGEPTGALPLGEMGGEPTGAAPLGDLGELGAPPDDLRPPVTAPLLLDVTPLSLGVATAGGFCEVVIPRNATIPAEQTKVFTPARDGQTSVTVAVCQGEAREVDENQPLGELSLEDLPVGRRGAVRIGVTFVIDADGTLSVRAEDLLSGRAANARIRLVGAESDAALAAQAERQQKVTVR